MNMTSKTTNVEAVACCTQTAILHTQPHILGLGMRVSSIEKQLLHHLLVREANKNKKEKEKRKRSSCLIEKKLLQHLFVRPVGERRKKIKLRKKEISRKKIRKEKKRKREETEKGRSCFDPLLRRG